MFDGDLNALFDQATAELASVARITRIAYDAHIAQGFDERQAERLTIAYLDRVQVNGQDGDA